MNPTVEERTETLLESGATGDELLERLAVLDAERIEAAGPIYPDEGELDPAVARDNAQRFRALRDEHAGEMVVPRSLLPDEPGRVAAALIAEGELRMAGLAGDALRDAQRELAEALVDLQGFRPDDQAGLILADPTAPEAMESVGALVTARAAIITWIRDDPSVVGSVNAIKDLDIRIGDGREALDAVNGYREKQAFGFLAMFGLGALVVIAIIVFIAIQVLT
jgi:hypothetical protein